VRLKHPRRRLPIVSNFARATSAATSAHVAARSSDGVAIDTK
jgi:hypothetical protein